MGVHEEGNDGGWLVPVRGSETDLAENLLRPNTMLLQGVAEKDDVFLGALMLVFVVLLRFDRRRTRRGTRRVRARRRSRAILAAPKLASANSLDVRKSEDVSVWPFDTYSKLVCIYPAKSESAGCVPSVCSAP